MYENTRYARANIIEDVLAIIKEKRKMKKTIYLGSNRFEWDTMDELIKEASKYDVIIGSDVVIRNNIIIDSGARIGSDVIIGSGVTIGSGVRIKAGVRISSGVRIKAGVIISSSIRSKVEKVIHLDGLYGYDQDIIFTDKAIYIRMGCFTRTVEEWINDLWNNDNEFPNDGSKESLDRLEAFNVCMRILGMQEQHNSERV